MSAPTITDLAAPVLLMAEAFVEHQKQMGGHHHALENMSAVADFKRALKEADSSPSERCTCGEYESCAVCQEANRPRAQSPSATTAHDALIAEARALADEVDALASAGHEEICRVCKNPPLNFTMSIPVREDVDTDRIIGRTVSGAHRACDSLRRLADALTASEPYRRALEQRLIGSNLPGLTGDADSDLMRFVFHEQEIAGYFCGQLEKDLTAELAARAAAEEREETQEHEYAETIRTAVDWRNKYDAAIARAERAENTLHAAQRELKETAAKNVDLYNERDTLRTQLAEAREELGKVRQALINVLNTFDDLTAQSHGVDGLHMNGDVATWNELIEGGRFEEWTEPAFSAARKVISETASHVLPAKESSDV